MQLNLQRPRRSGNKAVDAMALKSSNVTARAGEGIPADEFFDSLKQEVSDDVLEAVTGGNGVYEGNDN